MALPQYQYPSNALLDFSGLSAGVDAVGKRWKDDARKQQYLNALSGAGDIVDSRLMALAQGMEPDQGTNALFGAYGAAENRKLTERQRDLQERNFERQSRQTDQQIRLQQQTEARNAALMQYQIAAAKAEAEAKAADNEIMRGFMSGGQSTPAPQVSPMMAPQPLAPLPGPSMSPQSGDGFDPAMVRPMADTGAMPAQGVPQAPQASPDLIKTPYGEMPRDRAEKLAGYLALRGKKPAADMVQKALEQGALGKTAQGKFEEKAFNASELASRLDDIGSKFDEKFQTYETSLKMSAVKLADSFEITRGRIRPEDRAQFEKYMEFRRAAVDNLSQYIKEVTGAAMGVQEEKRIRAGIPDPEKDSPIEFRAKLNDTARSTKAALMRYNYLISQKYDPKALMANKDQIERIVKLEDMPRIVNERGAALKREILSTNPQADPGQVTQAVAARIKQEFGI